MDIYDVHASDIWTHGFIGRNDGSWRVNLDVLFCKSRPIVRVDFSGVDMADAPFWDGAIAMNAMERSLGKNNTPGCALLKGLNNNCRDNLWLALYARVGQYNDVRSCCVLMEEDDGLVYIFGKKDGTVKQTFEDLMACGELTSAHLASMNGLSLNAASTRLKTLYDLGLCYRASEETHYVYHFVGEGLKEKHS